MTEQAEAPPLDSPELALGCAHRRARFFWFWWMGIVFAIPGAAQTLVRTEQSIRIAPGAAMCATAVVLAIVAAFLTLMPGGMSCEALPALAVLAAWPPAIGVGLMYARHLHAQRERLFTQWLAHPAADFEPSETS